MMSGECIARLRNGSTMMAIKMINKTGGDGLFVGTTPASHAGP